MFTVFLLFACYHVSPKLNADTPSLRKSMCLNSCEDVQEHRAVFFHINILIMIMLIKLQQQTEMFEYLSTRFWPGTRLFHYSPCLALNASAE